MAPAKPAAEQAHTLEEALNVIRRQTQQMKKFLDTPGKLMDGLKCCSILISELRTNSLGPKQYYEVYMSVFDALRYLSEFLRENHAVNHLADLYEFVQYAGNILPRLYLMITVGTTYMSIPDAPVKEILRDMLEMSRGVQHPIRGLFLRYYLTGQARDHLPVHTDDGVGGCLQDSINFVFTNFVEMNKLWVRLQHTGPSKEREVRRQERQELQLLVGSNLVRLSQLVNLDNHKKMLGSLLEQIVQCRDSLAQEYLLEIVSQVFPEEFHLYTLNQLLASTSRVNPDVKVKNILVGLMERLSSHVQADQTTESPDDQLTKEQNAITDLLSNLSFQKNKSTRPINPSLGKLDSELIQDKTFMGFRDSERLESLDKASTKATFSGSPGICSPVSDSKEVKELESKPSFDLLRPGASLIEHKTEEVNTSATDNDLHTPVETAIDITTAENEDAEINPKLKLFEIFFEQISSLVSAQKVSIQDTITLLVSLVKLALKAYPDRLIYVDQVLEFTYDWIIHCSSCAELHSDGVQSSIINMMLTPVTTYVSLFTGLSLPNFLKLLHALPSNSQRRIAKSIAQILIDRRTNIETVEYLKLVLGLLEIFFQNESQCMDFVGQVCFGESYQTYQRQGFRKGVDVEEMMEEQGKVARIIHLIKVKDNVKQFEMLKIMAALIKECNEQIKYTTPAMVTALLTLAKSMYRTREVLDNSVDEEGEADVDNRAWNSWKKGEVSVPLLSPQAITRTKAMLNSLFKLVHVLISNLFTRVSGSQDLALRLFVVAGQVADQVEMEEVPYEFFAQAISTYEEAVSDSRAQFQALCIMAGSLQSTRNLRKDSYDTLITKIALHGSKLLKSPDQCRAVYLASHLWRATEIKARGEEDGEQLFRDDRRVLECLQRALRVADACMDAAVSIELFVEILNRYVYYVDRNNELVTVKYVNGLIELIYSYLHHADDDSLSTSTTGLVNKSGSMVNPTTNDKGLGNTETNGKVSNFATNSAAAAVSSSQTLKQHNFTPSSILSVVDGKGSTPSALESAKAHFMRTLEYIRSREIDGVVTEPLKIV